jgi:hypothetical protein
MLLIDLQSLYHCVDFTYKVLNSLPCLVIVKTFFFLLCEKNSLEDPEVGTCEFLNVLLQRLLVVAYIVGRIENLVNIKLYESERLLDLNQLKFVIDVLLIDMRTKP